MDIIAKKMVVSDWTWMSEGGIPNPYKCFCFDSKRMKFINVLKASTRDVRQEYDMKMLNEKTIGVRRYVVRI